MQKRILFKKEWKLSVNEKWRKDRDQIRRKNEIKYLKKLWIPTGNGRKKTDSN
jgi:hypothetical protein